MKINDETNFDTLIIVKKTSIAVFIASILFAVIGIAIFMSKFHSWLYLDFGITGASLFIVLLSVVLWLEETNYKKITFTPHQIIIKYQFKTIRYNLDKNTTYNTLITRKASQPMITIKGKNYHFNIAKSSYPDYAKLKTYLHENYSLNRTLKKAKGIGEQLFQFIFMRLGVALILFVIHLKWFDDTMLKELVYTEIKMAKNPKIYNPSKGSKSLKLYSTTYPEFEFRTNGAFTEKQRKIAKIIKKRDVIKIGIEPVALHAKLLKTRPSTFWERHYGWFRFFVQSIEFEDQVYIKDHENLNNAYLIWVLLFLGIIFTWFGWYGEF